MAMLTVGLIYEVFNPRYGSFMGKLISLARGEAVIEHVVAGLTCETSCNLAFCSFESV